MQNLNLKNQIFNKGSKYNFLVLFISYLAYPISIFLNKLELKPNHVTLLSLILALMSCYFFIIKDTIFFVFLWLISSLLDFCDGQIARMSKNVNKTAFNFDGLSDLVKIASVIMASAIYYNDKQYWLFCSLLVFFLPLSSILNLTYSNITSNKNKKNIAQLFTKNIFFKKILSNLISVFLKIDGHTLFLFSALAISINVSFCLILYLVIIIILNIFRFSYLLIKTRI